MKIIFFSLAIMFFSFFCGVAKPGPSAIGVRQLNNYIINPTTTFPDSINYLFFTKENNFSTVFNLTKSTPGTLVIPDFKTQSVVAIALQATKEILEVSITRAEVAGNELNIYYEVIKIPDLLLRIHLSLLPLYRKQTDAKRVKFFNSRRSQKQFWFHFKINALQLVHLLHFHYFNSYLWV